MLEVENLTARYPRASRPVIDGLSFSLGEGGLLALLGPSGCGKTTLVNLLAGVLPPAGGRVRFCGAPLSPRDTAIGLIPQSYGLLPLEDGAGELPFLRAAARRVRRKGA